MIQQGSFPRIFLSSFQPVMPKFQVRQEAALDWLAQAHALRAEDRGFRKLAERFGCGPDRIATRYHEPEDFLVPPSEDQLVFAPLSRRMEFFGKALERIFVEFYPDHLKTEAAPHDLIHVSCTGYVSPSAAQARVSKLGWARSTRITHAYHMGCYAALPALRMAEGALLRTRSPGRVDVAHTEICSLHFQPGDPRPDQWVIQSLFADGFIRYQTHRQAEAPPAQPSFELYSVEEELVPQTLDQMTWVPQEGGFTMTLGKDVPRALASALPAFIPRLIEAAVSRGDAGFDPKEAVFAVHPGGPRIIDGVQEALRLSDAQVAHSRQLLKDRGNLSSATLPHLWARLLEEPELAAGTPIVSLAFGPGLTLCGSVFRLRKP